MVVQASSKALSLEAVEALSAAKGEPQWMREWRQAAWQSSLALPMPSGHEEEWRRTDLRGLKLGDYRLPASPGALVQQVDALPAFLGAQLPLPETTLGGVLVQQDGGVLWETLEAELRQQGVVFGALDTALQQYPDLVRAHFMTTAVPLHTDKFTAIHAALWNGGVFIYVPPRVAVTLPLRILLAHATEKGMEQSHILLIADTQSQVTVVTEEISQSPELSGWHNGVVELHLKAGAQVTYIQMQNWSRRMWGVSHQRAVLDADSTLHWAIAALGSRLHWTAQSVVLRAPGSHSKLFGVMFADGRQHLDFQTRQDHLAPHTSSELLFKNALLDRARAVFRGVLHLRPEAQQTNAFQSTHSLLLSTNARSDALPILEIEADDVRCKHGSTTGRVDDEQLFYLMSRGLSQQEAQRMIVQGFFETVLTEFPVEGIREKIRLALEERI